MISHLYGITLDLEGNELKNLTCLQTDNAFLCLYINILSHFWFIVLKGSNWLRMHVCMLSCVRLFVTPWTVAHQAPLSTEFYRQENWSGLPFPSPVDRPHPGIKLVSPALAGIVSTTESPEKPFVQHLRVGRLATGHSKNFPCSQHIRTFPYFISLPCLHFTIKIQLTKSTFSGHWPSQGHI